MDYVNLCLKFYLKVNLLLLLYTSGYAPRNLQGNLGEWRKSTLYFQFIFIVKEKQNLGVGRELFQGRFLFGWWTYLFRKQLKTFLGPVRSYAVKETHFGSAVSEILSYRQNSLLLYIIGLCHIFQFIQGWGEGREGPGGALD